MMIMMIMMHFLPGVCTRVVEWERMRESVSFKLADSCFRDLLYACMCDKYF